MTFTAHETTLIVEALTVKANRLGEIIRERETQGTGGLAPFRSKLASVHALLAKVSK